MSHAYTILEQLNKYQAEGKFSEICESIMKGGRFHGKHYYSSIRVNNNLETRFFLQCHLYENIVEVNFSYDYSHTDQQASGKMQLHQALNIWPELRTLEWIDVTGHPGYKDHANW